MQVVSLGANRFGNDLFKAGFIDNASVDNGVFDRFKFRLSDDSAFEKNVCDLAGVHGD